MKKKLFSLALALIMGLSLTVPAFAAEADEKEDEDTAAKVETTAAEDEKDGAEAPAEGEDAEDAEGEDAEDAEGEDAEDAEAPAGGEDAEEPEEAPAEPAAPVNPFTDVAETSPFYQAILWAVDQGITNGTTPTTFGPGNTCTVRQILTFLCRANTKNPAATLDASVAWAVEQGMISEDDDTTAPCTRAMAVTFMWKAAGSPETEAEASFTDVAAGADYAAAVAWAVDQKVTSGTSATTFAPDNTCTRGQIVTFLYRANQAAE